MQQEQIRGRKEVTKFMIHAGIQIGTYYDLLTLVVVSNN
jgi:hypothetical protein